jgi:hypothetical protein
MYIGNQKSIAVLQCDLNPISLGTFLSRPVLCSQKAPSAEARIMIEAQPEAMRFSLYGSAPVPLNITDAASLFRIVDPSRGGLRGALECRFQVHRLPDAIGSCKGTALDRWSGRPFGNLGVVAEARLGAEPVARDETRCPALFHQIAERSGHGAHQTI